MLSSLSSRPDYYAVLRRDETWQPAMQVIAQRHGLASLRRSSTGTHVVYLGDAEVVKLFAPFWPNDFAAERRMLEHVDGRLPIATPGILAAGELEGWPYLVMTRLEGQTLDTLWSTLAPAEQRRLLSSIGELAAALHALPLVEFGRDPAAAWSEFVALRKRELAEKHTRDGLPEAWVRAIEHMVAELPSIDRGAEDLACLHTDMHAANLMVRSNGDRLELSGLFDFGDAMVGGRDHELIAPAAFMAANVPGGLRALLHGRGYAQPERDDQLVERLTGHLLLQRYCALPALISRFDPPPTDLSALLARLWDFDFGTSSPE